jgi:hypothetical protein
VPYLSHVLSSKDIRFRYFLIREKLRFKKEYTSVSLNGTDLLTKSRNELKIIAQLPDKNDGIWIIRRTRNNLLILKAV